MNERYQFLYQELLKALGHLTEGGPISLGAHIGSTSVAELATVAPLDLMLVVEPFPLTESQIATLQGLGYRPTEAVPWSKAQRFVHDEGHRLFIYWWADHGWNDPMLVRDYLRHDADARRRYLAIKADHRNEVEPEGWRARFFPQLITEARAWWVAQDNFATLHTAIADLAELSVTWRISSGWALDLFLGAVSRYHEDVDIIIDRQDQLALQHHLSARGWRWVTPLDHKLEPWPPHMCLELPRHQAHAHHLREDGENGFLDCLFTDFAGDIWRYRREPSIVQTVERAFLTTSSGLRYLAPELVLLFKSRNTGPHDRSKDQTDFEQVLPALDAQRRAWLRWALLVTAPEHPWLGQLRAE